MNNIILIIAFISLLSYGVNILMDITYERPLSAHQGYGIIAIITTWNTIPILGLGLCIIFVLYTGVTLAIYIESKKSKNHASNYKNS